MHIDQIQEKEFIRQDNSIERNKKGMEQGNTVTGRQPLRNLSLLSKESPFYNREDLEESTILEKLEKHLASGMDATLLHNQMAVYAQTTSPEDFAKMQKEGFSPMEMDAHTIVTVTDHIKMALAKGGFDISCLGGISDAALDAMTTTDIEKIQVEDAGTQESFLADESLEKEVRTAMTKAMELEDTLSMEGAGYMVKNQLSCSIDHVYQAVFSSGSMESDGSNASDLPKDVIQQLSQRLTDAGLTVSEKNLEHCKWMMDNQIPLTEENLREFDRLLDLPLEYTDQEIADRITDAVLSGRQPGEASLWPEDNLWGKAKDVYQQQLKEIQSLKDTRLIHEARLRMSVEANYSLLKKGIAIDTMSIQETCDALRQQEERYLEQMIGTESVDTTRENVALYQEFQETCDRLAYAPASYVAQIPSVTELTMRQAGQQAASVTDSYAQAEKRYETVWTAPRRDLGDDIQKAFANVDVILEEQGMEPTESNRRAVRILAYNEMELTKENINTVKATDEALQRMFKSLKPANVMEMIRQGKNPLDLTIQELSDLAGEMEGEFTPKQGQDSEEYAKFLWKLERTGDITEEQRSSYIGIYRMIHQVEAGDGAAIGALMAQQTEVTLRNLMTAVRSSRHSGRSYTVDDSFGEIESFERSSLSITQQAEMAFQADCLYEAGDKMTPHSMGQFENENAYMDLTPEHFLEQLEKAEETGAEEDDLETAYAKETGMRVARALESEEQIYSMLEKYDIPATPAFLNGISEMLRDRNSIYRNLLKYGMMDSENASEMPDIASVIQDLIEDYGEACKTPEEMAKAQRKLEETAEKVMKDMLVEKDVSSIDVRGMKLVMTQIQALGKMGENSETYHIPIMVEDKLGNLSLKIVRGTEETGLAKVAFSMEETGTVYGSFRYEAGEIRGDVEFSRKDVAELFSEHMPYLAKCMTEETGLPVSFRYGNDPLTSADKIYDNDEMEISGEQQKDEVSTRVLYGIARTFIQEVSELLG